MRAHTRTSLTARTQTQALYITHSLASPQMHAHTNSSTQYYAPAIARLCILMHINEHVFMNGVDGVDFS